MRHFSLDNFDLSPTPNVNVTPSREKLLKCRRISNCNRDDLNFPSVLLNKAAEALEPDVSTETLFNIAAVIRHEIKLAHDNSPYPEVSGAQCSYLDPYQSAKSTFNACVVAHHRSEPASRHLMTTQPP